MANNELKNKYFVRRNANTAWEEFTTKFNGAKILSVGGLAEVGEAINIYDEQWQTGEEDFMVTSTDGKVKRKNVDITVTFIVSRRYATTSIDEQTVYDNVVSYFCDDGAFYIKSAYNEKSVRVACIKGFKPTTQKLHRGKESYIMATATLHTLEKPSPYDSSSYTAVVNPSGNPKQKGYYERDTSTNEYRPTWDTSVVSGKTYYTPT